MVVQDTTFSASGLEETPEDRLRYWRSQLREVTAPELPTDRTGPLGPGSRAVHGFDVPVEVAARLTELVGPRGVSLLDVAVATVQFVLARYTGSADVAVATVADDVVILRSTVDESSTFVDFLLRVRDTVRA